MTQAAANALATLKAALAQAASRPDDDFVYLYVGRDWPREGVAEPGAILLGDLRALLGVVSAEDVTPS